MIELLVVVGIISILASIATPNFLEAQTRAKVSRVKNDARAVATALECYSVDNNNRYPERSFALSAGVLVLVPFGRCDVKSKEMKGLTTPIAYISNLPLDVFNKREPYPFGVLDYWSPTITRRIYSYAASHHPTVPTHKDPGYVIVSDGPDGALGYWGNYSGCVPVALTDPSAYTLYKTYDPTNGTVSYGNIFRLQSGAEGGAFFNR